MLERILLFRSDDIVATAPFAASSPLEVGNGWNVIGPGSTFSTWINFLDSFELVFAADLPQFTNANVCVYSAML